MSPDARAILVKQERQRLRDRPAFANYRRSDNVEYAPSIKQPLRPGRDGRRQNKFDRLWASGRRLNWPSR